MGFHRRILLLISLGITGLVTTISLHDVRALCKVCQCDGSSTICSARNIRQLDLNPDDDWSWVNNMDLSGNQLTKVPNLRLLSNLTDLNLRHNNISKIEEGDFSGLSRLRQLDLDENLITFKPGAIAAVAFGTLTSLHLLRMKQRVTPDLTADYQFLVKVNSTLQHLYMTGIPELPDYFSQLNHLQTLSLGGEHCNISEVTMTTYSAISQLNLRRFSVRNCGIRHVDSINFFRFLRSTLEKLDLSCNPVIDYVDELMITFKGSKLKTWLLDFINQKKADCDFQLNSSLILDVEILSFQANHLNKWVTNFPYLRYINAGQNTVGGAGFTVICNEYSEERCWASLPQQPSLRFFGLDMITQPLPCSTYDANLLRCNTESELFENDDFEWDQVTTPHYPSPMALFQFYRDVQEYGTERVSRLFREVARELDRDDVLLDIFHALMIESEVQRFGEIFQVLCENDTQRVAIEFLKRWRNWYPMTYQRTLTDSSIAWTVEDTCQGGRYTALFNLARGTDDRYRFLYANFTTLHATKNNLNFLTKFVCNDIVFYYNNWKTVRVANAINEYISCGNITGLDLLEEVYVPHGQLRGWNETLLESLPALRICDFTDNSLGQRLKEHVNAFKGGSNIEILLIGNQKDRVEYLHSSLLTVLPRLRHLDLHGNNIRVWNLTLTGNPQIERLNLSFNSISSIDKLYRDDFDEAQHRSGILVDLRGNPLVAEDELFISWIQDREYVLWDTVITPTVRPAMLASHSIIGLAAGIPCAAIIFAMSLALIILIKKKKKRPKYQESIDVFISFPESDTADIARLQQALLDYKINLIDSLEGFGAPHSQNLSSIISSCRKCLLVINANYFTEDATKNDFRLISNSGMLTDRKTILLLKSARMTSLPLSVRQLIDEGRYIIWPDCVCSPADGFKEFVNYLSTVCHKNDT